MKLYIFLFSISAERRAQLSRSRSRTNLVNIENSVTRDISFDDTLTDNSKATSQSSGRRGSKQDDESEAEKLLARLKAL